MAQGKMKVKTKVPDKVAKKNKGKAVTQRANKPMKSKKTTVKESQKLKQAVTRSLNNSVEKKIREQALPKRNLSGPQQAVAAHHSKMK